MRPKIDKEIKEWLSFATEKLDELDLISKIFFNKQLTENDTISIKKNKEISNRKKKLKKNT